MPPPPLARTGLLIRLLLLLALPLTAAAAEPDPWGDFPILSFDDLTVADGLPHDTVSAVTQDRAGLIWIGTFAGLARYDGYRMRQWEGGLDQPGSLPDTYVRALLPLSDGGILVGMGAAGLARYDPGTDLFQRLTPPDARGSRIYALAPARDAGGDAAWVATDDGLFLWRAADNEVRPVPLVDGAGRALNDKLFTVMEDADGTLWAGGVGGLVRRAPGKEGFTRITTEGPAGPTLAGEVWTLARDGKGRLWVGSGDSGAAWLSPDSKAHAVSGLTGPDGMAGRRTIRAVAEVPGRGIWFATDGAGLIILDPDSGRLRQVRHDPVLPGSLNGDRLRSMLVDRTGNIWLSSDQGLERYDPYAERLRVVPATPLSPLALTNPEVFSTFADSRSRVWLGLANGDVDVLDLKAQQVHRLRLPPPHNGRDVRSVQPLPDGRILAAGRGVAAIDPASLAITPSAVPCLDGEVLNTMIVARGEVLAGSFEGLTRYSPATGECRTFRHDPADPRSLVNDNVRALAMLADGRIVVGTAGGLSVSDGRGGFHNHLPHAGDPDALSHGYITGAAEDRHGRLWLSTAGGGLVVTDVEDLSGKPRFRAMRRRNGLPHDNIGGVGVDPNGRVWFTTPSRIGRLDPQDSRFTLLGDREGASLKFYTLRAMTWGPGGKLLLGGLGGLGILDPDADTARPPPAPLTVTGLAINHQPLPPSHLPQPGAGLQLSASERTIALDFALLDYRPGTELRYRHRLDGFDQDWLDSPQRAPGASYTNLPAGHYVLRVEAVLSGQETPVATLSLPVAVAPLWYETMAARIGGMLAMLLAILGIVQVRTAALSRQRRRLEAEVAERTRDLVAANSRLDVLASTDPLTGLLNRRRFLELAAIEHQRAARHGRPLSLLLIDLDHFKRVNDTHGHRMGDAVLRTAAGVLSASVRASDLAARFGGEELVLLLPETELAGAAGMAERLRRDFAAATTALDGKEVRVTASIGVAGWRGPGESLDALLHRADQALYAAKHGGRDKVMVAAGTV
ncbi:diguanylate cyclase [Niveispirillum sp. KHB5.9]|uniref:ligand-binding sensor domain-containing diguanylate cyclase n=1 Tax=Niveispirillum sp. KHB5.9 TaxID=3400269 RepID=UPI003A885DEA